MDPDPRRTSAVSSDGVGKILDLIVSDHASNPSIHSVLEAERLPVEVAARLEAQAEQVRGAFWRWRRREQELAAILAGVRELAELRDVDELLHRIVDRARGLMGADVAYLTEHHNDALRVRITSGVVAPELRDLFVPVGMGLASKVVTERAPQWTADYQATHDIPHERGIDDAVSAEGLVSLLGVPLLAGNEVLGALFAANRTSYEFSPDEVALLGSFADHAAIVLQTARLLETARSRAQEARDATRFLSDNLAAMERASRVHEDLTSVVVSGGSAREVAATLSTALGRRVIVLDRDLSPVADVPVVRPDATHGSAPAARAEETEDVPSPAVRTALEESRHSGLCVQVGPSDHDCDFAVAVVSDDAMLGALLLGRGELGFGAVERRTVERAAQIMALVTLKQDAIIDAENRVSDELVSDVLNPRSPDNRAVIARARARGVQLDRVRSVVVAAVPEEVRRSSLDALRQLPTTVLAAEEHGLLVTLSSVDDPRTAAAEASHRLRRHPDSPVLVIAGPSVNTPDELPDAFDSARRCAALLDNLGRDDGVVDVRAYKPYLAMFGPGDTEVAQFIEAMIGPVLQWDRERGGELLPTLASYIEFQGSPTRVARALHVHVNTVLQRLERLTSLLGPEWREADPLFRVAVAVRLHLLSTSE